MASGAFRGRLVRRCERAGVSVDEPVMEQLVYYFQLLAKWNLKINLTALPLAPPTDEAIDRLLVEPLAAAPYAPEPAATWFDLGSGGGSPALPLRLATGPRVLVMVEAKARKAAFLREAIRELGLSDASVANARFEEVSEGKPGQAQLVTVRAVRADAALASSAAELLGFEGRLVLFTSAAEPVRLGGFEHLETVPLLRGNSSFLAVYRRVVPRGT